MGSAVSWCVSRGDDDQDNIVADAHQRRRVSICGLSDDDDFDLEFFDCIEPEMDSAFGSDEKLKWPRPAVVAPEWWLRLKKELAVAQARVPPPAPPRWWLRLRQQLFHHKPPPRLSPPWWWLQLRSRSIVVVDNTLKHSVRQCPEDALVCIERLGKSDTQNITESNVSNVTHAVRKGFQDRIAGNEPDISSHLIRLQPLDLQLVEKIEKRFPELDACTEDDMVRRTLRAACGNERDAILMLTKAIECRLQDRELFHTMQCEVTSDIRVLGNDVEGHPVVYVCARSQQLPLKALRAQIMLAFEAAIRLEPPDGQVVLIADMTGFRVGLNMDPAALKELGESLGTMFADRLNSIILVDFSFLAQALWSTCKSFMSERTQQKVTFVGEKPARQIAEQRLDSPTCERLLNAFKINRDWSSTSEARRRLAERTTICEVPIGMSGADKAG